MKLLRKPAEPVQKTNHHYFESFDAMNSCGGNVVTDRRGFAYIEIPEHFESLYREFRYQLTVVGQFARATVLRKAHNRTFTIRTDRPEVEVSWQVTGVHQNEWSDALRILSENDGALDESAVER